MTKKNKRSIFILCYAAFICLTGFVSIKGAVEGLPFTIQDMASVLGGVVTGGLTGAASCGFFLILGALGVPVFAGMQGGMPILSGLSGGFLAGYFVAAVASGLYIGSPNNDEPTPLHRIITGTILAYLIIYIMGTIQFIRARQIELSLQSIQAAISVCVVPYLPFTIVKIVLTIFLAPRLRPLAVKYL